MCFVSLFVVLTLFITLLVASWLADALTSFDSVLREIYSEMVELRNNMDDVHFMVGDPNARRCVCLLSHD